MNINRIGLNNADQRTILEQTSVRTGYIVQIVEKDWWVTTVLEALFSLPFANQLSFKGGTSLSKCWGLINRFSEDIDIAVTREQLGFTGVLSKNLPILIWKIINNMKQISNITQFVIILGIAIMGIVLINYLFKGSNVYIQKSLTAIVLYLLVKFVVCLFFMLQRFYYVLRDELGNIM